MNRTQHITERLIRIFPLALMFILGALYLYWFSSYIFFEQEKSSLFLLSFSDLTKHLNQPGGFLVYISDFQTTFYFYPLAGALIVSLEIVGVIYFISRIGLNLAKRRFYFLPFFIGAWLYYFQLNNEYTAINNLGIFCQLFIFYISIHYLNGKRSWMPVVLFPGLYFLFGIFSALFLVMISILFLQKKEWLKLTAIWLIGILFFFIGKDFLFFQTTETLLIFPFLTREVGEQTISFSVIAFLIAVLPILFQVRLTRISNITFKKIKLVEITPFLIIIVLAFLSISRIDKMKIHFFHVEKLFCEQKYDELIAYSSQFPPAHSYTKYLTNIALAETGRLTESLFHFRQIPDGTTLFLKWEINRPILQRGGHFYYSLGMINEAHRWAYESMVFLGHSPESLKMMIKTDLIKGNFKTAELYISILAKSVFYRKEATYLKSFLYNEEAIALHPELGRKKLLDTKQDFFIHPEYPPYCLDLIIEADSTNRMALEYKLAWLILQKDMQGIIDLLPAMEKAGYTHIPMNVEELVLVYQFYKIGEMPELERLQISAQSELRFQEFNRIFLQYQGNKQMAQPVLARNFSDTYWYYVFSN